MANVSGNAYGLTILSPLKSGHIDGISYADIIRDRLNDWGVNEKSPMAKVPNTYLCRLFILDDVFSQSLAAGDFFYTIDSIKSLFSREARLNALAREEHLKSKYLVFTVNLHGDLDTWLTGMWQNASSEIKRIWQHCWAFDEVTDASSFVAYMKKCQLETTLFFVGSTDDALAEQLKGLYLKQEMTRFASEHQGMPAAELQQAWKAFVKRTEPANLAGPSWTPGMAHLT
jgi:hypothetical protein